MSYEILVGDVKEKLLELPDESVQCVITSPPYWGLRDYGTARWEGGDPDHDHKGDQRFYVEKTAAKSSSGAFSLPGEGNIKRLKDGRRREGGKCECGAIHSDSQLGMERTPQEFVDNFVTVCREIHRVLKKDGTFWLNIGDSYYSSRNNNRNGATGSLGGKTRGGGEYATQKRDPGDWKLKAKDLCGIPWRVALALQDDGWWLRQDIIWSKPNPMPEPAKDRCVRSHEYMFLLSKARKYFFDYKAIQEEAVGKTRKRADRFGGNKHNGNTSKHSEQSVFTGSEIRNKRSVWNVPVAKFPGAHFAIFPERLVEPVVLAGSRTGDVVLDPFSGSGTAGVVSLRHGRKYIGIELNPEYAQMSRERIDASLLAPLKTSKPKKKIIESNGHGQSPLFDLEKINA